MVIFLIQKDGHEQAFQFGLKLLELLDMSQKLIILQIIY